MKPKALILTLRSLHNGPRMIREIKALKHQFDITAVGYTAPIDQQVVFIDVVPMYNFMDKVLYFLNLLLRNNSSLLRITNTQQKVQQLLHKVKYDIIIVHEPFWLPYLCHNIERKYKIVFNAHEYHPLEFEDKPYWKYIWQPYYEKIYAQYLPEVDLFMNVCESIREKCLEKFGKDSVVITNASSYYDIEPTDNRNADKIKIIHHGGCQPSRKIEEMIRIAQKLGEQYELHLMLIKQNEDYSQKITQIVAQVSNVKILHPVSFNEIVPYINKYDIGLFFLPPTNYNYSVALPNKLFEFVQARLCVVIGPSKEMARYVKQYDLGLVGNGFEVDTMVEEIKQLSRAQIFNHKQKAHKAAKIINEEADMSLFMGKVNDLLAEK